MKTTEITATNGGWMVRSDAVDNELFFKSGASAESAAIRLAHGLAEAGAGARVEIYLRDGSLARRLAVPPMKPLRSQELVAELA
jgi:hypothetical protein